VPHCPECQQEASAADSRCPLDRNFFVLSCCPRCQAEVFPKERFCAVCGSDLEAAPVRLAAPLKAASVPARVTATLLDGLALLVAYEVWLSLGWSGGLPAVVLLAVACWGLLPIRAGQTLGQHVMGQVVLTEDRRELDLKASLIRMLAAACSWSFLGPLLALFRADGATIAEAWTRTRTWSLQPDREKPLAGTRP
jgi:uncharacterized RDD family membrane protein YckC